VLKVAEGVSAGVEDIMFNIHPESKENINNNRRSHRDKRNINKVFSDGDCRNAQHLTYSGTYPINLPFYEIFEPVHISNLVIPFLI
jgi:hypothetical protein